VALKLTPGSLEFFVKERESGELYSEKLFYTHAVTADNCMCASYPTRKYSILPQLINKFQTPISSAFQLSNHFKYSSRKYSTLPQLINKFQIPISAAFPLPLFLSPTLSHPLSPTLKVPDKLPNLKYTPLPLGEQAMINLLRFNQTASVIKFEFHYAVK